MIYSTGCRWCVNTLGENDWISLRRDFGSYSAPTEAPGPQARKRPRSETPVVPTVGWLERGPVDVWHNARCVTQMLWRERQPPSVSGPRIDTVIPGDFLVEVKRAAAVELHQQRGGLRVRCLPGRRTL